MVATPKTEQRFQQHAHREPFGKGPEIIDQFHFHPSDRAVAFERQLAFVVAVPGMGATSQQKLDAIFRPFYPTAAAFFCPQRNKNHLAPQSLYSPASPQNGVNKP